MKDLRIGQISYEVENKLKVSSTNGKSIYVDEKTLNDLAICYPKDYLKMLSIIKKCIKKEKDVYYSELEDSLLYQDELVFIRIKRLGRPKKWYLESVQFKH